MRLQQFRQTICSTNVCLPFNSAIYGFITDSIRIQSHRYFTIIHSVYKLMQMGSGIYCWVVVSVAVYGAVANNVTAYGLFIRFCIAHDRCSWTTVHYTVSCAISPKNMCLTRRCAYLGNLLQNVYLTTLHGCMGEGCLVVFTNPSSYRGKEGALLLHSHCSR